MKRCQSTIITALLATSAAAAHAAGGLTFINRAPDAGVTNLSYGRGASFVDIDGDGLLDIITANAEMENGFFRQLPDHTFEDATGPWGIAFDERSSWGVLVADFDNDGDPDVYIINGGFIVPPVANQLLRNDIDTTGVFTDVSASAGDAAGLAKNFGGTAFDYDHDGDLDIFQTTVPVGESCILIRNDGNLVFTDVSAEAGIVHPAGYRHCSSGDFNNDGWMDVVVGGFNANNLLYKNNGDGTFTEMAVAAGIESPAVNFGLVLDDFDNDGWMDIYDPKWNKLPMGPSELYVNNGDETFTNVTSGSGTTSQPDMGHNTGDLDSDGYPDIYIGTGIPSDAVDDVLYTITPDGSGGLTATDVTASSGVLALGPTRCHGIAFGDYDLDGDIDVYTNNGGVPTGPAGSLQENGLWENQGNANRWTKLRLIGTVSNRTAVGTRCRAVTNTGREVHRMLRVGTGFCNTDSYIQHFGIGTDTSVTRIDVTWPSGIVQTIFNPAMEELTVITEGETQPGDLDANWRVNVDDVVLLVLAWGSCALAECPADFDEDDDVDIDDLVFLLLNWT